MNNDQNHDLYEILEISPNASQETIERMFRYFAQRYHPDREGTGDSDRFRQIVEAYDTLKEPESRAAYDSRHKTNLDYQWSLDGKIRPDCRGECYACGILPIYNDLRHQNPGPLWLCPEVNRQHSGRPV